MKKSSFVIPIFFLGLIFLPGILMALHKFHFTSRNFRGHLSGFFDAHEKIEFSKSTYASREYQSKFEDWLNSTIALRGYYIRLYNQIQFTLFKLSNRIVGENNDIFEMPYIDAECGLSSENDFSLPENYAKLESYVNHLESVQHKLEEVGKTFLFYTTPSKAAIDFENIPYKYRRKKRDGYKSQYFYLKDLLASKDVNYIDSRDFLSASGVPDFYTTGIHWARPIEQIVSRAIIDNLSAKSKKQLPKIVLKELKSSKKPMIRDADVFDLANIIVKPCGVYYEYEAEMQRNEGCFNPKFLIQGGSFSEGFYFIDYADFCKDSYKIFYDSIYRKKDGTQEPIAGWEGLDFSEILNDVDFVVVELNEAMISNFSHGFVDYLDSFLDSYMAMKERKGAL